MDRGMFFKERLNRPGLVDRTPVPEKNKALFETPEKISQKGLDLGMPDILGDVETDVKTEPLSLGRDADG